MRKKRRLPPAVRRALLRAARTATEPVSEALGPAIGRLRGEPAPPPVALDDVRRRLELLVGALYGRPIPIDAVEPPPRGSLVRRVMELGGRA